MLHFIFSSTRGTNRGDGLVGLVLRGARGGAVGLERVGAPQLAVDVLPLLGFGLAAGLQLVLAVLHRALPAGHVLWYISPC